MKMGDEKEPEGWPFETEQPTMPPYVPSEWDNPPPPASPPPSPTEEEKS